MSRVARELERALDDPIYNAEYYARQEGGDSDRPSSGYEVYDRQSSNANIAAYLIWKWFDVRRTLDLGCASGFVVEALRELGFDASGSDVSQYAIDHYAEGARGHLRFGDLTERLPYSNGAFELVSALETFEHVPPDRVPHALREVRRITSGLVVATIPSFGPNANGPGGWFDGKVEPDRLEHYNSLGPDYGGPVAYDDLFRDARGEPIEGHLTIASFGWWTQHFEEAGFVRCAAIERAMHHDLARFGLTKYWNLYVFRLPDAPEPSAPARTPEQLAEVEQRFGIDHREADPEDLLAVREAIGSAG
jgi:SAM-dependent methyltransferase